MVDFARIVGEIWFAVVLTYAFLAVVLTAIRLSFRAFMRAK